MERVRDAVAVEAIADLLRSGRPALADDLDHGEPARLGPAPFVERVGDGPVEHLVRLAERLDDDELDEAVTHRGRRGAQSIGVVRSDEERPPSRRMQRAAARQRVISARPAGDERDRDARVAGGQGVERGDRTVDRSLADDAIVVAVAGDELVTQSA